MSLLPIVAVCAGIFILAYLTYGRAVARLLGVDPSRRTPAVEMNDGIDYVPAPAPVVLGGHFTAIAAAGPIVGPILAGQSFGWLPAMLWIMIGAVLIGGVHDAGSLMASIRHGATSITQVVRRHMSRAAYTTFLLFVWVSLLYVIIAFADLTAASFARLERVTTTVAGQPTTIALNGGAVVIGAAGYLLGSVILGLLLRFTKVPWWGGLSAMVVMLGLCIWKSPDLAMWLSRHGLPFLDTSATRGEVLTKRWDQVLLGYCFIASVVPMWLLLQPRGLIGATFLYAALFFGAAGTLIGGAAGSETLKVQSPHFVAFTSATGQMLFPFLFITVACGACSGFHSIVSSGTTCKQIRNERDVRPVAYGAMLLEGMVAIFALACVMIGARGSTPDVIYATGMARFMSMCGIPEAFGIGFGLLAFSSFVFDTLDVCTRLGRYVFQELLGLRGIVGGAVATLATIAGPSAYLWLTPPGSFRTFWTIFGTSNQLLAALTLLGITVWLWRSGRRVWFTLLPAIFMLATTGTALVFNFRSFLRQYQSLKVPGAAPVINMVVAVVLFGLAALVVTEAVRVWRRYRNQPRLVVT